VRDLAHELFGGGIGDGADGEVHGRQAADIIESSRNPEVSQQDSVYTGTRLESAVPG
jgi:hypothetical protein